MKRILVLLIATACCLSAKPRSVGSELYQLQRGDKIFVCLTMILNGDESDASFGPIMIYEKSLGQKHRLSVLFDAAETGDKIPWMLHLDDFQVRIERPAIYYVYERDGKVIVTLLDVKIPPSQTSKSGRQEALFEALAAQRFKF